jgi:hypothetical protein
MLSVIDLLLAKIPFYEENSNFVHSFLFQDDLM